VSLDSPHEAGEVGLPPLDPRELRLPLPREGRAPEVRMDAVDEADALLGRAKRAPLPVHVLAADERLDDLRARGRGAEPALLHGLRQLTIEDRSTVTSSIGLL